MPYDIAGTGQDLLIDGKRVQAASGRYFQTLDPSTEEVLAEVAEADAADVDAAVRSARAAFENVWAPMRAAEVVRRGIFRAGLWGPDTAGPS